MIMKKNNKKKYNEWKTCTIDKVLKEIEIKINNIEKIQ